MITENIENGKDFIEKIGIGIKAATENWLKEHSIVASKVESGILNGSKVIYVDVDGDVTIDEFNLDDVATIPVYIKFRNVTGKFILGNNKK